VPKAVNASAFEPDSVAGSTAMAGHTDCSRKFGRQDRLLQPGEFSAVMASRTRLVNDCFELRYLSRRPGSNRDATNGARLGLIVPKRLAKRAVLRNMLKRLAREAFRQSLVDLPPMDFVLRLAKPALAPGQKVDSGKRRMWRRNIDALLAGVAR
jgi:ribonuclease P protein component